MKFENTRPSEGVAYHPWVDRIRELLDEEGLSLPPNHELRQHYWADLSYSEVVNKVKFKDVRNVWMELHVRHDHGKFEEAFNTSEQAKAFFKRFPELRKELDKL